MIYNTYIPIYIYILYIYGTIYNAYIPIYIIYIVPPYTGIGLTLTQTLMMSTALCSKDGFKAWS